MPPNSKPSLRAIDERTWSAFSFSPSIALDLITSAVSAAKVASFLRSKPRDSMLPSNRPCRCRASASNGKTLLLFQLSLGQAGLW